MLIAYVIPPLVVLAAGAPVLPLLVRWGRPTSRPACSCGYSLSDLPSGVCPECGAAHADTWAAFLVRRRRLALLLWTLACGAAGLAGWTAAVITAPMIVHRSEHALFTYPAQGPHRCDLQVDWESSGPSGAERFGGGTVHYTRGGREERVELAPGAGPEAVQAVVDMIDRLGTPYADLPEVYTQDVARLITRVLELPSERPRTDLRANSFGGGGSARSVREPILWPLAVVAPMWVFGVRRVGARAAVPPA